MDGNFKNIGSPGRARGHSFLSILKGSGHHVDGGGHDNGNGGHPGIPVERLREGMVHEVTKVTEDLSGGEPGTPEPQVSALTMAFQGIGIGSEPATAPIAINPAPAVPVSSNSVDMRKIIEANTNAALVAIKANDGLRKWCSGLPPKTSFLSSDDSPVARLPMTRRSTLAEKPELDDLLAATKIEYNGHEYLPLTVRTVHRLSPFHKGEKPMADTKIFSCIMITPEVNNVHADHVVAAIERIGIYCKHLLVVAPIQTTELGNVFNREAGNITPGNDWNRILKRFPNLKHLAFVHPEDEPVALSRGTFSALHAAVVRCQATHDIKGFKYDGPVQLFTNVLQMVHAMPQPMPQTNTTT